MITIRYSNGTTKQTLNMRRAYEVLKDEYPDMVVYDDGERTLVWGNYESSVNDPGAKAIAELPSAHHLRKI